jgi:hypothetical protein
MCLKPNWHQQRSWLSSGTLEMGDFNHISLGRIFESNCVSPRQFPLLQPMTETVHVCTALSGNTNIFRQRMKCIQNYRYYRIAEYSALQVLRLSTRVTATSPEWNCQNVCFRVQNHSQNVCPAATSAANLRSTQTIATVLSQIEWWVTSPQFVFSKQKTSSKVPEFSQQQIEVASYKNESYRTEMAIVLLAFYIPYFPQTNQISHNCWTSRKFFKRLINSLISLQSLSSKGSGSYSYPNDQQMQFIWKQG